VQYKYFYKLGHQNAVGLAEAQNLNLPIGFTSGDWLFSDTKINLETTGSLVFAGVIEKLWPENYRLMEDEFYPLLEETISNYLKENPTKSGGIVVPYKWQKKSLMVAKKAGLKKVNVQIVPTTPNYGHWKQAKVWWMLVQEKGIIWLARIDEMANQEFWSDLDMKLPKGDMARGIINMKFARTLLNFTEKKLIWDPFAGHGRVILAGLDLKEKFYASDINEEKLNLEIVENYNFATSMYKQEFLRKARIAHAKLTPDAIFKADETLFPALGKLEKVFRLDANYISSIADTKSLTFEPELSQENFKNMAIVTEGYLGFNFKGKPLPIQMKTEWESIAKIWSNLLIGAGKLGIAEIICCVPFYQVEGKKLLPPFLSNLDGLGGYKLTPFNSYEGNSKLYLEYSRPQANVGHLVLKFVLQ
jgi:hypothetical protein